MGFRAQCEEQEKANGTSLEMQAGRVWAGRAPEGGCLRITCLSGTLWATGEGAEDHILGPGESFRTPRQVLVVVEALEDSEIRVKTMGRKAAPWWMALKGAASAVVWRARAGLSVR